MAQASCNMSSRHSESPAALHSLKNAQSQKKQKVIQPFRFLDLPPGIRETIYDLWIPGKLHVSLGRRGIRLEYFMETLGSISFQILTCTQFFLNRQFYDEFCHALFTRSTWYYSSTTLLVDAFVRLPKSTRDQIRHLSLRLTEQSVEKSPIPPEPSHDGSPVAAFETTQWYLRQMKGLQTLFLNINLIDFGHKTNPSSDD